MLIHSNSHTFCPTEILHASHPFIHSFIHSFIHPRTVGVLVLLGSLATSFILATAVNSPEQLWGQTGAVLTVLAWILSGALFSYVKVMNEGTGLYRTKHYNYQFLWKLFFLLCSLFAKLYFVENLFVTPFSFMPAQILLQNEFNPLIHNGNSE